MGDWKMQITEILTRPAAETRVMIKRFRFRPHSPRLVDAAPDVWLDSGNLADWLGDAISRVEWVAAHDRCSTEPHDNAGTLFEAYLDGELIGEIRDDAGGRTYYALA
jgi:hypothetical protein